MKFYPIGLVAVLAALAALPVTGQQLPETESEGSARGCPAAAAITAAREVPRETVDAFTPTPDALLSGRASSAPRFTAAQVKRFVRDWFALFDRNADVTEFLAVLADQGLLVKFPEETLWNHADFRRWYEGVLRNISKASHELRRIDVLTLGPKSYQVDLEVLWQATTTKGEKLRLLVHQAWRLEDRGGDKPVIVRYLVAPIPEK